MDPPRCPRHGQPLVLLEDGVLNGVRRTYWGCHGITRKVVRCQFHAARGEHVPSSRCACRGGVHQPCDHEAYVDDPEHTEPALFS